MRVVSGHTVKLKVGPAHAPLLRWLAEAPAWWLPFLLQAGFGALASSGNCAELVAALGRVQTAAYLAEPDRLLDWDVPAYERWARRCPLSQSAAMLTAGATMPTTPAEVS